MTLIIVPIYAAVLALGYVVLGWRITQTRRQARVSLGTGGNTDLERRIRVHGNFGEYVPFALLLLAFIEMQGHSPMLLQGLCLLLVVARAAHAYGLSTGTLRFRVVGVVGTFVVLTSASVALLSRAAHLWMG